MGKRFISYLNIREYLNGYSWSVFNRIILLLGFSILLAFSIFPMVYDINELNNIMAAAHSGAILGTEMDSLAIYPRETFENYVEIHPRLKTGSKVIFIGVEYEKGGYDSRIQKE